MPKNKWQYIDDWMQSNSERGAVYFQQLRDKYEAAFDEFVNGVQWTSKGNIKALPENRVRLFTMRKKMLMAAKDFVDDVIIDEYSRQLFELGNDDINPATYFSSTGQQIGQVARSMYSELAIDTRLIVANKLISAADHVTLKDGQAINELFRMLQSAINGGWDYSTIQGMLQLQEFSPNHAQTITRGFYSEIYQEHQNTIAEIMQTDYFQLVGPPPLLDDDGHYFCQNNYGKILKKDEWLEQAQIYSGVDAGLDPDTLFVYGNGGYNCRHQLIAVPARDIQEAKSDEVILQKTFDKLRKNYE